MTDGPTYGRTNRRTDKAITLYNETLTLKTTFSSFVRTDWTAAGLMEGCPVAELHDKLFIQMNVAKRARGSRNHPRPTNTAPNLQVT